MENLIRITDKELITELNAQLLELIRIDELEGRKILAIVRRYPEGYKLPTLICGMVKKHMAKHHDYLITYGDICDIDKTSIDELKEIL